MLNARDVQALRALKTLYDKGILTAAEFAAKKAMILAPASTDILPSARPSLLVALPADVLERVCVGVPLGSLPALTATCRAARRCVEAETFFATRLAHGYAERVLLETERFLLSDTSWRARESGSCVNDSIEDFYVLDYLSAQATYTTDGRRGFFTVIRPSVQRRAWYVPDTAILMINANGGYGVVPLPYHRFGHCLEWFDGQLVAVGGMRHRRSDSRERITGSTAVYDEATRSWDEQAIPDMLIAVMKAVSWVMVDSEGHDELYIAGGYEIRNSYGWVSLGRHASERNIAGIFEDGTTDMGSLRLQIYSSRTGEWRFGPNLPSEVSLTESGPGYVEDGKFHVTSGIYGRGGSANGSYLTYVYDPDDPDQWITEDPNADWEPGSDEDSQDY